MFPFISGSKSLLYSFFFSLSSPFLLWADLAVSYVSKYTLGQSFFGVRFFPLTHAYKSRELSQKCARCLFFLLFSFFWSFVSNSLVRKTSLEKSCSLRASFPFPDVTRWAVSRWPSFPFELLGFQRMIKLLKFNPDHPSDSQFSRCLAGLFFSLSLLPLVFVSDL